MGSDSEGGEAEGSPPGSPEGSPRRWEGGRARPDEHMIDDEEEDAPQEPAGRSTQGGSAPQAARWFCAAQGQEGVNPKPCT